MVPAEIYTDSMRMKREAGEYENSNQELYPDEYGDYCRLRGRPALRGTKNSSLDAIRLLKHLQARLGSRNAGNGPLSISSA